MKDVSSGNLERKIFYKTKKAGEYNIQVIVGTYPLFIQDMIDCDKSTSSVLEVSDTNLENIKLKYPEPKDGDYDLVVDTIYWLPKNLQPGENVTFTAVISNIGADLLTDDFSSLV